MTTINALFSDRGSGPYSKAIKVKVVAREAKARPYRGKDGSEKAVLTSGVSDGERVIKVICYDPAKFNKFKVRIWWKKLYSSLQNLNGKFKATNSHIAVSNITIYNFMKTNPSIFISLGTIY